MSDFLNFVIVLLKNTACLAIAIAVGSLFGYITKKVLKARGYDDAKKAIAIISMIGVIIAFVVAELLLS